MYKSFLDMEPPPGYVPGVGRGATGFTTRSDIGPAAAAAARDDRASDDDDEDNEERFKDADGEIEEQGLFSKQSADDEDKEADRIFAQVNERMGERRKAQREEREKKLAKERAENTKEISSQFESEKHGLKELTEDDWASIPEAVDITRKNKRRRTEAQMNQRSYATPDTLIAQRQGQGVMQSSINPNAEEEEGQVTDFQALASAKNQRLSMVLNQVVESRNQGSESGSGSAAESFDHEAFLQKMKSQNGDTASGNDMLNIGDVDQKRELYSSLIKHNPSPDAYLSYARLEEKMGKLGKAKKIIMEACESFRKDELLWLENIRLNEVKSNGRIIASEALRYNVHSAKLWLKASELEEDKESKIRVLHKALESIQTSEELWKALIDLNDESEEETKELLEGAVEFVPTSEDFWLALAQLVPTKEAKKILGRARKALRTSSAVWIYATRLEEDSNRNVEHINKVMERAVKELESENALPKRQEWIAEAYQCESEKKILSCHAIIKATIGQEIEEDDRAETWKLDAKDAISKSMYETARAIYAHSLRLFPTDTDFWQLTVDLESQHGTSESYIESLHKAVDACPHVEDFWISLVKQSKIGSSTAEAQKVISRAFKALPASDKLWDLAIDLEVENGNIDKAKSLLNVARDQINSELIWIKSIIFERIHGSSDQALRLVEEMDRHYPLSPDMYLHKAKIYEALGNAEEVGAVYAQGAKVTRSERLWLAWARLLKSRGNTVAARGVLDQTLVSAKESEEIWLERVRFEKWLNNEKQASVLLSQALQKYPKSGTLWSERIWMEPSMKRLRIAAQALEKTNNDPIVICTMGRVFWGSSKDDKAKNYAKAERWFETAVNSDPNVGDFWLWYYRFLEAAGKPHAAQERLLERALAADPQAGEIWSEIASDEVGNYKKSKREVFLDSLKLFSSNGS